MGAVINPVEFAREGRSQQGETAVANLERLADVLADRSGVVSWSVVGERGQGIGQGRRKFLNLSIEGELQVICQRCLGGMPFRVQVENRLELIEPGQAFPEDDLENDSCDAIEVELEMDLLALVEDEILLALPPVPRHVHCVPPVTVNSEDSEEQEAPAKPSPFAALAGLKRSDH